MQGLFSSLADKAQSALGRTSTNQGEGASGQSGSGGILKSHAFESIHHQFRSIQQQYSSSTTPVQKIITTQKGIALDYDSLSRDTHAHSKELYTWGQNEHEDLKDVTDRLAWMHYIEGSLAATLAKELDAARVPFKALRDAESGLSGRRNIRASFENQIARIEHEQRHGMEQKLAELKRQLRKAEEDDEPLEKEVELLKRKAVKESELMKWTAIREYAEKLALVAQAGAAALPALPTIPSSATQPYTGDQLTASLRTTLQQALDQWQPGSSTLLLRAPTPADLNRSDTRSFGETHARELARINTADPHATTSVPVTPPATYATYDHPPQAPSHTSNGPPPSESVHAPAVSPLVTAVGSTPSNKASPPPEGTASPPLNPAVLNQAPAPIPTKATSPIPVAAPNPTEPEVKVPTITPTVAETGVPKSAGPDGPGPASGSLKDIKHTSPILTAAPAPIPVAATKPLPESLPGYAGGTVTHSESAEEEKKRLEREERERLLREGGSTSSAQPQHESAEEEKKRLEREERERLLAAGGSNNPNANPDGRQHPDGDSELPPYQEF
ncbi:Eisosome component PIL1-domain-containing protein [Cerioporus squamosus]|nr:Eisosome component PIL1-domain-containing protein [Cerioporus squamosus]